MYNILVTGANGQLGSEIKAISNEYDFNYFFTDHKELDITNESAIKAFVEANNINVIINCAAYTAVDKAEDEKELADLINHKATKKLAKIAFEHSIKLVHVSTDYVFDGDAHKPYNEAFVTKPKTIYGQSKLNGEKEIFRINPANSIIIRTSWLYSSFGANFVKTMLRYGKEKESLNVVYDQVGTPTYARDLAKAILRIIPQLHNSNVELYHYSNEGAVSWYDFAKEIMKMAKISCTINPILSHEYPTKTPRPHYSVLDKAKIKRDFGLTIAYWKESLDECLHIMGERAKDRFDEWNGVKKKIQKIEKPLGFDEQDILLQSITPLQRGGAREGENQSNNTTPNIKKVKRGIMKNILLTGTAGFIGSNFVPYFIEKYQDYKLINLDLLTYAGDLANLKEVENHPRYKFIQGDICNRELVEFIFAEYAIEGVIHFAAESHVDNSIKNPDVFIKTNVNGTHTLIDVARKFWGKGSFNRFHHISTDEVYGTLGETGLFSETTPYAPNSPYSASKAGSDMIVRAYHETYGMNTVITNCSNNYGPKQHNEKLIPTIIRNALAGNQIPIYGDGKNIRDWLYVLDHCKGIDLVYHKGKSGDTYNIGGRNERDNNTIADKICTILDEKLPKATSYKAQIKYVEDRAGHDRRYAIDAKKLENELGWKADENFDTGIVKTIEWYLKKYTK